MDFTGKVIIVTGASSGIGADCAVHFAKLGGKLTLVGRNMSKLIETAEKCKEARGNSVHIVQSDVAKEDQVEKIVKETIEQFGRIDILVNNAGILQLGTIENTSLEQFDTIMNTNVRSMYQLTALAVPHLITTKGNIVNVSSVNGIRSFAGVLAYNMSKSAVDQFTRCVALELAPKQVRCNSVNPGVIITELQKRGGLDDVAYKNFLERCKSTHALQRPGTVDEVSPVIAFLASDLASFITGVNLPVDGGRHAMCPR